MDALGAMIEQLKTKEVITDLESDILETSKELSKEPFDRPSASLRMGLNYGKYPEIFIEAGIASGGSAQLRYTLSDDAIRENLQWQLLKLAKKRIGGTALRRRNLESVRREQRCPLTSQNRSEMT